MYAVIRGRQDRGTSGVTNLHPHDFCAPFDSAVQLQLLHAPTTMSAALGAPPGGLADSMVSESFLAVPDVASPPMPDWQMYSFSAERTFTRARPTSSAPRRTPPPTATSTPTCAAPRRRASGQLAVSIAWSAQPATHERAARAAEASAAGASSFITAHARGKPLEGAQPRCPAPRSLRVGEHVRADELDPNAPQDAPLLAAGARRPRGRQGRVPRARLANQLQWVRGGGGARPHAASTSAARGRSSESPPPTSGSSLRRRPHPAADARAAKAEAQRRGGDDDDDDDADERGAKQKGRLRAGGDGAREQEVAKATRSYVTQTGDFVREPIADSEQPHRAHRTARPPRSPCPPLSPITPDGAHAAPPDAHPPPTPARPPATSRAHLLACASVEPLDLDFAFLFKLCAPRRKLLPRRRERQAQPGSADVPRKIEVLVQSAVDLPVRGGDGAKPLHPFVEVSFQGQTMATELKGGPNPMWNQMLHLELTAPGGDWSQKALINLHDELTFNVFDKVKTAEADAREANVRRCATSAAGSAASRCRSPRSTATARSRARSRS